MQLLCISDISPKSGRVHEEDMIVGRLGRGGGGREVSPAGRLCTIIYMQGDHFPHRLDFVDIKVKFRSYSMPILHYLKLPKQNWAGIGKSKQNPNKRVNEL